VKEKLGPTIKETQSEEEIQVAKDQAKKEGTTNLFQDIQTVTPPKLAPKEVLQTRAAGSYKKKKKPDSVCTFISSEMRF
jgi:large subunit ribosomal protein L22